MRIQHAFRLITLSTVATTVAFASYLWLDAWRAHAYARDSHVMLQAFRATLIAAEHVSAERGPSNAALGAELPLSPSIASRLSHAREISNASLDAALAALHNAGCRACAPATATLELARAHLGYARVRVDHLVAQPLAARRDVQMAVAGMFAVVDELLPITDRLRSSLQRTAPVAAQHAVTARFAAELREYAGRAGSEFTSSLVSDRQMRTDERERLAWDFGRVQTLGELIRQRVSDNLESNPRLRDAEAALRQRYFGEGIAYLQQIEALGPDERRPSTAELAGVYVPLMAPIIAMRDAELDVAEAEVTADTREARHMLEILGVVLATTLTFVVASFWLFSQRILRPLTQATAATVNLAEGRYDTPLPSHPKADEIGTFLASLDRLRASLRQKMALESERMTLITQLQGAAEHDRTQVQELAKARDAAEASARAKSTFLAMMSHEIRTPLQGILGLLELLQHSSLSPSQERHVRLASDSGQALRQILDDVLDYAKIEAGRLELFPTPVDLRVLCESVASLLAPHAQAKALQLRVTLQPKVPAQVLADGVRLRQILLNLLGNAIKFTERGSVNLCATVEAVRGGEFELVISVSDTGIGIAAEDIPRLFTPFVQSESGSTRRFDGTGLGLTISRQLAHLMDGELILNSRLHVGTCVTLRVPLIEAG